jgi:hypothetical protein
MSTKCPCKDETADGLIAKLQLEGSPEPDRVVTMVHGTFAEHAPWMREGRLWRALKPKPDQGTDNHSNEPPLPPGKSLPGTTLFSRFCWTGFNSHTDRLQAGEALAKRLRGLTEKFPKARHYVIGHSHGGNVMLYAMKDEALSDRITGAVTLATPFITVRRRKLHWLVLLGIAFILACGLYEALSFANASPPREWRALSVAAPALIWLFLALLSALKYRGGEFGSSQLLRLLLRRNDAESVVSEELKRLKLTPDDEGAKKRQLDKMLVARPFGDEALMSLVASQFFSWVQNRILTMLSSGVLKFFSKFGWFSWMWKLLVVIGAAALAAFTVLPYTTGWFTEFADNSAFLQKLFGDHWVWRGAFVYLVVGILAIPALYGLMSLISLLVLLVAASPFGLDAMFWNHYFSTTAEASPPGSARVFLQSPPPTAGSYELAHSGIYTDPKVIDEIVDWIKCREATPTDVQASVDVGGR